MEEFVCSLCKYVYSPERGDIDNGIEINTLFADLPDNWVCPICGAVKEGFYLLEE
ncbi:MAG: rubredoxin [Elusimicrobiota bacterium]|jgi:rubredoxin|nr:rubredoxin [Elusimicrobiota bacterium]